MATAPPTAASLTAFVPTRLVNPLNGSHGHWATSARRVKTHREATALAMWAALRTPVEGTSWRIVAPPERPKRVTFTLHVARRFDSDALPAICKPFRDELQALRLIHHDGPDSGHVFAYAQRVQKPTGVAITVTLEATP